MDIITIMTLHESKFCSISAFVLEPAIIPMELPTELKTEKQQGVAVKMEEPTSNEIHTPEVLSQEEPMETSTVQYPETIVTPEIRETVDSPNLIPVKSREVRDSQLKTRLKEKDKKPSENVVNILFLS